MVLEKRVAADLLLHIKKQGGLACADRSNTTLKL